MTYLSHPLCLHMSMASLARMSNCFGAMFNLFSHQNLEREQPDARFLTLRVGKIVKL